MGYPSAGLNRDGRTFWYRHNRIFWEVEPSIHYPLTGPPVAWWHVTQGDYEGVGKTISEAITAATYKEKP